MNDNTQAPTIEKVGIDTVNGELIVNLINLFGKVANPLRIVPGVIDTELMTAAVTFAGCIHGELIAMGMMDEDAHTKPEQANMLMHNYAAGVEAGKDKVAKAMAREGNN